jgi:hypothetical protein
LQVHDARQFTRDHETMQIPFLWSLHDFGNTNTVRVPKDLKFSLDQTLSDIFPRMRIIAVGQRFFDAPNDFVRW